jgi:hypothetical protein
MASGIAPDRLSRVGDEKQAGDATVKYKAM